MKLVIQKKLKQIYQLGRGIRKMRIYQIKWMCLCNHKDIGTLYLIAGAWSGTGIVGTGLRMIIRIVRYRVYFCFYFYFRWLTLFSYDICARAMPTAKKGQQKVPEGRALPL